MYNVCAYNHKKGVGHMCNAYYKHYYNSIDLSGENGCACPNTLLFSCVLSFRRVYVSLNSSSGNLHGLTSLNSEEDTERLVVVPRFSAIFYH